MIVVVEVDVGIVAEMSNDISPSGFRVAVSGAAEDFSTASVMVAVPASSTPGPAAIFTPLFVVSSRDPPTSEDIAWFADFDVRVASAVSVTFCVGTSLAATVTVLVFVVFAWSGATAFTVHVPSVTGSE